MLKEIIYALAPLQFFLRPATILLLLWAIWLTFIKKDKAMGLALYVGLVIIVDAYMGAVIPLSGVINVAYGSIRYSDFLLLWLLLTDSYQRRSDINVSNTHRKQMLGLALVLSLLFLYAAFRTYTIDYEAREVSHSLGHGLRNYRLTILKPILSLYIASTGFRNSEDYKKFLIYLLILGIFFSVASVELKFFDRLFLKGATYDKLKFWQTLRRSGRIAGFFLNPNNMGNLCVVLLPLYILGLKIFRRVSRKIFVFLGLLALLFVFLLTESRGSFFGFFVTIPLLIFLPVSDMKLSHKIGTAIITILVFFSFMPGAFEKVTKRLDRLNVDGQQMIEESLDGNETDSLESRVDIWKDGLKIAMTSPIFGIGLGGSNFVVENYFAKQRGTSTIEVDHAHSSYLNMFIQTGIIAVIVFLIINMIVVISAIKTVIRVRSHELSPILVACSTGIVGYLVCIISQNSLLVWDVSTLYWVLLGIVCALTGRIKHEDSGGEKNTIDS